MRGRSAFIALVALLVVTSMVAVPAAAGAGDAASADRITSVDGVQLSYPPDSQVMNATEEVKIWERAIFPLRADTADAAFSVSNAPWLASLQGTGTKTLDKDDVAVYETGDGITLTFDDKRAVADTELAGQNVEVFAARVEGNQSATFSSFSTLEDLKTLLTDQNTNENASFERVSAATALDSNGDATFEFTPSEPGHYVVFTSKTENGSLSIANGDEIKVSGNVTVVGADALVVRRGAPSVSPDASQISAGDDVTFSVDAGSVINEQAGENVSHAILLYDEATYASDSEQFKLVADSHLDKNFDVSQNVTLEHSIHDVNGVQRSVGNATVFGVTAESGVAEGSLTLESVLNYLVQNTSLSSSLKPATTPTGSGTTLDASMTVKNGTASDSLLVKTRNDWRTACYRWLYLASNDSGTEITSHTGNLGVGTSCDTGGSQTVPGDGGDDDGGDGTTTTTSGSATATVSSLGRQVTVNVEGAQAGDTVTVQRDAQQVDGELQRHGTALEGLETTFSQAADFDMQVTTSNNKPDPSIPDPPSDRGAIGYINVQHSASDDAVGEVAFNFRATQQRLDDAGLANDEVVLYRYSDDGEWTALETEFVGTADDGSLRFRAVSPGLSTFAIGGPQAQQETPTDGTTTTTEPPTTDAPTDTTTAPPGGEGPGGDGGGNTTLIIAVIVILAIVVVGGLYWYREQS